MIEPQYQREGVRLYLGDCLDIMPTLGVESVDAIIADPPYGIGFWDVCDEWISASVYLLSRQGSFYTFCGIGEKSDSLSRMLPIIKDCLMFKNLITWKKQRGYGTQRNWMYTREEIIFAVRSKDYYFCPQYTNEPRPRFNRGGRLGKIAQEHTRRSEFKRATNVWGDIKEISPGVGNSPEWTGTHPTQKPVRLIERIILASTREGNTVLDPFMGSGTTGVACVNTGRNFIGIELSGKHFDTAKGRIETAQPRLL